MTKLKSKNIKNSAITNKVKDKLSKSLPKGINISEASNILSSLVEIQKHRADIKKTKLEIENLKVKENIIITKMEKNYEIYNKFFNSISIYH